MAPGPRTPASSGGVLRGTLSILALLLLLGTRAAEAQLRPLPPLEWALFDSTSTVTARGGAGVLLDQRASLAGTEGTLLELGEFAVAARTGRMAIEVAGTILRLFEDEKVFASPHGGAQAEAGPRRTDAGDFRVATMILLTPPQSGTSVALRFGTRLPTTDNEVGLERDRTDFFALLGGRMSPGRFRISGEAGVGINGTHDTSYEQSDVLMYSVGAAYRHGWFSPRASLVGHMDGMRGWTIRGNEELAELRWGVRLGREIWTQVEAIHGLLPFSPRLGFMAFVGLSR